MTIVECTPIGVLIMEDSGAKDEKSSQFRLTTPTTIAIKILTKFRATDLTKSSISLRFTKLLSMTKLHP